MPGQVGVPLLGSGAVEASAQGRRWTLVAVCTTTFMLLLDITIVVVALPSIQRNLDAGLAVGVLRQRPGGRVRGGRRAEADARVAGPTGDAHRLLGPRHLLCSALPDRLRPAAWQFERLEQRADPRQPDRRCRSARGVRAG